MSTIREPLSSQSLPSLSDRLMEEHLNSLASVGPDFWWLRHRFELVAKAIPHTMGSVLDFGCGTGMFLSWLNEKRPGEHLLYGFDPTLTSPSTDHRATVPRSFTALTSWPPPVDPGFDVITMMDVLEHLDEDQLVLRNLLKSLNPKGRLIITVPAFTFFWSNWDKRLGHRRRYHPLQLRRLLTNLGLEIETLTCLFSFLTLPAFVRKFTVKKSETPSLFSTPHPLIHSILNLACSSERRWLNRHRLSFGTSILAVARKVEGTNRE